MINLKNVGSSTVVIIAPDMKFRRELAPGRVIGISQEVYDELSFDPGFNALLAGHYIKVSGLEKEAAVIEQTAPIYDAAAIATMYDKQDFAGFAKFLPTAAPSEKETAVKLAIDKGITAGGFTALIKKYCDVDVVKAIAMKHELEEA